MTPDAQATLDAAIARDDVARRDPDPLPATETLKANPVHAYADYSGIGHTSQLDHLPGPNG